MIPLLAWYWWLFFAVLIGAVLVAGLWGAFMDRRRGREVERDPQRPGPRRPEDSPRR